MTYQRKCVDFLNRKLAFVNRNLKRITIEQIKATEKLVGFKNYRMCLKDAVGVFTKQLINNLFDVNHLTESGPKTRIQFLKILERLSVENGEEIWNDFESSFITIRKKLDLDAEAAHKNDPAAKSLEEVVDLFSDAIQIEKEKS